MLIKKNLLMILINTATKTDLLDQRKMIEAPEALCFLCGQSVVSLS